MLVGKRPPHTPIVGRETLMEGADMRVRLLTLGQGQSINWHFHNTITDSFVCVKGSMIVETQSPHAIHRLEVSDRLVVPPKTPHFVHGVDGGPCQFLVLQGVGIYDNVSGIEVPEE